MGKWKNQFWSLGQAIIYLINPGTCFACWNFGELYFDVVMWRQKLVDAALKQQKKLQDMSVYVPSHVPERMSMLNLDTNKW